MWEKCDWWFQFPNWWTICGELSKKDVYFLLSIVIFQIVVQVSLQRGQNFESFSFSFVDFLFVGQTAPILYGDEITHLLV